MARPPIVTAESHQELVERTRFAVGRLEETQSIEFKESQDWSTLSARVARTCLAMSNLRDGGIVVIGISERDDQVTITGVDDNVIATYDTDVVIDQINKFADPPLDVSVVAIELDGNTLIVIHTQEFREIPTVCKRSFEQELQNGTMYFRPRGRPRTEKVQTSHELREILDLAAEKRTRQFISTATRVGLLNEQAIPPDGEEYDREIEEFLK
ncbi:MAG: ATP-binding protein [Phycisphaerales bacterium JB043]